MKSDVSGGSSANKVERKVVEKNRRIHMKSLCFKLSSIIPKDEQNFSKDALAQHDHLDQATCYIKNLRARIEKLKRRKNLSINGETSEKEAADGDFGAVELRLPVIEVRHQDSILEVVLITNLKKSFMFYQVIGVLEEEGAEVVNASFSTVSDKIFYTIHAQAISPRIGLDASRVSDRLKELSE